MLALYLSLKEYQPKARVGNKSVSTKYINFRCLKILLYLQLNKYVSLHYIPYFLYFIICIHIVNRGHSYQSTIFIKLNILRSLSNHQVASVTSGYHVFGLEPADRSCVCRNMLTF